MGSPLQQNPLKKTQSIKGIPSQVNNMKMKTELSSRILHFRPATN